MHSSVVLLSSGLDSTVNLFESAKNHKVKLALTFNYQQRAAQKEIESAKKITDYLKIPHRVVEIPWVKDFGQSALIDQKIKVPTASDVKIDDFSQSMKTAKSVWVPNRNGIFLNIAAGFAESLEADFVIPGFNKEEAATFPDNTLDFLNILTNSFSYSTSNQVKAFCFTAHMNKTEIVKRGEFLKVPWKMIWPCYLGGEEWCRQCESCQRSLRAFKDAGVKI